MAEEEENQRLRCLLIGVEIEEEAERLHSAADRFRDASGGERVNFWGRVQGHVSKLDTDLTRAEACGLGANGHLAGEFVGVQEIGSGAMEAADGEDLVEAVRAFRDALREAAGNPDVATGENPGV